MMREVEEPLLSTSEDSGPEASSQIDVSINQDPPVPEPPEPRNLPRHRHMTRYRIMKNVFVESFAIFVFMLGFFALSNLQSSLNAAKGLGVFSQATIYGASMLSSLFLPELFVKTIGCKKTLVLAVFGSVPYLASNVYPAWATLIPTAVLLGLSSGPLTASQAIYTSEMARRYHKESMLEDYELIVARFFGIYSFFSESTQLWGNLISYYVLRPGVAPVMNLTHHQSCGTHFDKDKFNGTNPNLEPPSDEKRYLLVGIYVLCGVASALMLMFFLDPLENDVEEEESAKKKCGTVLEHLSAAVKHVKKLDQLLLIPLSVYTGIEMSFYTSDFTQAFIACSWGVHHVGFVTICFGVCGALMALLVGPLVKCISQMSVILLAAVINIVTCVMLFVWQPSPAHPVAYFAFAGVWGMSDAIWWSQIAALYGLMFPNDREAAFSNFFFWSFLGYFLSYSYANYFSVAVKIYIMLAFLIFGIAGYIIGQVKIKCARRSGYIVIGDSE